MTVEVDAEDAERTRDLVRDSREGLGFIDAQIFGSGSEEMKASEKVDKDPGKVENITKPVKNMAKTGDVTQKTAEETPEIVEWTKEILKTTSEKVKKAENASAMLEKPSASPQKTSPTSKIPPTLREGKSPERLPEYEFVKGRQNMRASDRAYTPVKNRYRVTMVV